MKTDIIRGGWHLFIFPFFYVSALGASPRRNRVRGAWFHGMIAPRRHTNLAALGAGLHWLPLAPLPSEYHSEEKCAFVRSIPGIQERDSPVRLASVSASRLTAMIPCFDSSFITKP